MEHSSMSLDDLQTAPWTPARATEKINGYANSLHLEMSYKRHAMQRLAERGLTTSDVLYVLRHGHVYDDAVPATHQGLYKYSVEGSSPNTSGRSIRVIVIPSPCRPTVKIVMVTAMWIDEG